MEKAKRIQRPWTPEARQRHLEGCRGYQKWRRAYELEKDVRKYCDITGYDTTTFILAFLDERFPKTSDPEAVHEHIRNFHREAGISLR